MIAVRSPLVVIGICCTMPLLSACMSIAAHLPREDDPFENNPWPYPYQATLAEADGVITTKPAHGSGGGPFRILFLLDLPLTAALDTLFLPIDAVVLVSGKGNVPPEAAEESASGSTPMPTFPPTPPPEQRRRP